MISSYKDVANLGMQALQALSSGDAKQAERLARIILERQPGDANGLQVLGAVALNAGDHVSALHHLRLAAKSAPNHSNVLNMLGVAQRRSGDLAGAVASFRRAGEAGLVDGWLNLGKLESERNEPDAAIAAYERAVQIAPENARAHAALAYEYEGKHDLERAKRHAAAALALAPKNPIAAVALARSLLREKRYGEAVDTARIVGDDAAPVNRALALGVMGDALDRQGLAAEAFAAFAQANQLLVARHQSLKDNRRSPHHPDVVRAMTAFIDSVDMQAWPRAGEGRAPVFLVGFPRSGTTLLDQILSSHTDVFCLEEKECLAHVAADLALNPSRLADLSDETARRDKYWAAVSTAGARLDAKVFIDKLPLNIVFLPAVRRIFPDAKVIVALRDPRDVVLSCFQQRFSPNEAMAQLLELDSAAAYYDVTMTLLEACRARLGLRFHSVRYEDVVKDIAGEAQKLCAFLDIAFEPVMLRFNETARRRAISTPSIRQVVEPLYDRSIGRWRAYAEQLAPVLPRLQYWADYYGYS